MFRQLKIRDKLLLALGGAALLAFVLASTALMLYQRLTLEDRARQVMEPYAQLVSAGTDAAVAFEDPVRALEILKTLRANPQIREAAIVLESGQALARFNRASGASPSPFPPKSAGVHLGTDTAELQQDLSRGARLHLVMDLEQLREQMRETLWMFGAATLVLLLITLGQLLLLLRTIVRPVTALTDAAERVRAQADYAHTVPASGNDEVARLGQSFNAMIEAVREREGELRQLTAFQRTILDNAAYAIISTDPAGVVTSFNPAAQRLLGYTAEEVVGKHTPLLWHDPAEVAQRAGQLSAEFGETVVPGFAVFKARSCRNLPNENEWRFIRKDGSHVPVLLSVTMLRDEKGGVSGFVGLVSDLTERKQAEEAQRRLTRELRAISDCNQALMRADDESALLGQICRIICDEAGYHMAWVGYAGQDEGKPIRPVAWAGVEDGYFAVAGLTWDDTERGRGPAGAAIRSGASVCIQDFASDPAAVPWRDNAVQRGYRSSIALPLKDKGDTPFGVLGIYSADPDVFDADEIRLLEELAGDLAFGINVLRARVELKRAEQERLAHLHFLESMDRINRAIAGAIDLDALMSDLLDATLSIFACDRVCLAYPCDPASPMWSVVMEKTRAEYPGTHGLGVEMPITPQIQANFRKLREAGGPVIFDGASADPLPEDAVQPWGCKSVMAMVVYPKAGKPWQLGLQQCSHARVWTAEEERLFAEIGRRLADGLTTLLAHRDLQQSEGKLAKAQRIAHIGYLDRDIEHGRITLSDEALRIFGLPPQEGDIDLAQWQEQWLQLIHPLDRNRVSAAYAAVLQGGRRYDVEYRVVRPNGEVRLVHSFADLVQDESGRIRSMFGTMLDITERKQAEERLVMMSNALDRVSEAAYLLDEDARLVYVNEDACRELGYSREELLNMTVMDIGPGWTAEMVGAAWKSLHGRASNMFEAGHRRKDGSVFPVEINATKFEHDGKAYGLALCRNITERKRTEEELERHRHHLEELVATRTRELAQARDAAEAANRAKSAFIAKMSHELRTPLNGILGYAQILQRDLSLDGRQSAGLNVIRQSGEQLLTLINDILDLAKIESGRLDVHADDIPLAKFLHTIGQIVGVRAEQKGLVFSCVAAPGLPAAIRADERLLRQTLLNLLSNAVKYTDSGTVTLRVTFLPPSRLRFAVEDSGVGIAADQLEAIFRPFEQVGEARLQSGGSGLGLAISREFVRRLGGDILVESRVGVGSTFWFEVEAPPLAAAGAPTPPMHCVTGYRGRRRKILIVEDLAGNRTLLADMLEPLGFQVVQAANGREGIARAAALQPDLILMDTIMPEMDGLEATRRLRAMPGFGNTVIIAISASASLPDREKTLQMGANAFLPKPIELDDLLAEIAALLDIEWIYAAPQGGTAGGAVESGPFIVPPAPQMEALHRLALQGNMRDIERRANELSELDERYRPFADRLRQLALDYQSKAVLNLVEQYTEKDISS